MRPDGSDRSGLVPSAIAMPQVAAHFGRGMAAAQSIARMRERPVPSARTAVESRTAEQKNRRKFGGNGHPSGSWGVCSRSDRAGSRESVQGSRWERAGSDTVIPAMSQAEPAAGRKPGGAEPKRRSRALRLLHRRGHGATRLRACVPELYACFTVGGDARAPVREAGAQAGAPVRGSPVARRVLVVGAAGLVRAGTQGVPARIETARTETARGQVSRAAVRRARGASAAACAVA